MKEEAEEEVAVGEVMATKTPMDMETDKVWNLFFKFFKVAILLGWILSIFL